MTMANLSAVRAAIAAQINQYVQPALTAIAEPLDQINPPAALILPGKQLAKYSRTLGGPLANLGGTLYAATDFNIDVCVVTSHATTTDRMQETLDQWLGFENGDGIVSVPMAIDMDITLGGAVEWCIPTTCDSYGPIEWSGQTFFGARIHFEISLQ
jgi:hypothetical protein